ncbi:hypothetical protein [Cupriavidus basilensis]|uniref:hypothetical protein n=1 Tax=Cupriavidus basilensis TaxID=68895 RepID=UPI000A53F384|nr:hypothetical protein [Cupriavidus basilensis]
MSQNIELFSQGAFEPVEKKIARAVGVVVDLFREGPRCSSPSSVATKAASLRQAAFT